MKILSLILMICFINSALSEGRIQENTAIDEALENYSIKDPSSMEDAFDLFTEELPPDIKDQLIEDMVDSKEKPQPTEQQISVERDFQSITNKKMMSVEKFPIS